MADNTSLPVAGGGNETFANHEISAVKYPRMRTTWGPSGVSNDVDVASGKMLPTQLRHSGGTELADSTGIKLSTTQLPTLQISQQPFSPLGAQAVYLPSDHPALPVAAHAVTNAGTFATQTAMNSAAIYNGATSMTPKWAVIAASSSGANAIVAAVTSKKIRVLAWDLAPNAAVNAKWQSGSTDLTGLYYMAGAGNGNARNFNPVGWFETAVTTALNLNLSGATACGGVVVYVEV